MAVDAPRRLTEQEEKASAARAVRAANTEAGADSVANIGGSIGVVGDQEAAIGRADAGTEQDQSFVAKRLSAAGVVLVRVTFTWAGSLVGRECTIARAFFWRAFTSA